MSAALAPHRGCGLDSGLPGLVCVGKKKEWRPVAPLPQGALAARAATEAWAPLAEGLVAAARGITGRGPGPRVLLPAARTEGREVWDDRTRRGCPRVLAGVAKCARYCDRTAGPREISKRSESRTLGQVRTGLLALPLFLGGGQALVHRRAARAWGLLPGQGIGPKGPRAAVAAGSAAPVWGLRLAKDRSQGIRACCGRGRFTTVLVLRAEAKDLGRPIDFEERTLRGQPPWQNTDETKAFGGAGGPRSASLSCWLLHKRMHCEITSMP